MDEVARGICQHITQEKDLFEKSRLIYRLKKEFNIPLKSISEAVGIKPSYLCHILRLRKLPALVVDGYYSQAVSISHLFIISRLHDDDSIIAAYEKILNDNFTILQTEILVREMLYKVKSEGEFLTAEQKDKVASRLASKNIQMNILQSRSKAKLTLELKGSLAETTSSLLTILNVLQAISSQHEEETLSSA